MLELTPASVIDSKARRVIGESGPLRAEGTRKRLGELTQGEQERALQKKLELRRPQAFGGAISSFVA